MRPTNTIIRLAMAIFLGACGSAAEPDNPDAAPANNCLAAPSYGNVVLADQAARSLARPAVPDDPVYYEATGYVNADPTPDRLLVGLFEAAGVFAAGPVVPGTYQIQGDELNFGTCGVCVRILPDVDPNGDPADNDGYLATSGTVEITAVTPRLVGSVSGLTFQHVEIFPNQGYRSAPHPDGCQTALGSASFDAEVVPEIAQ